MIYGRVGRLGHGKTMRAVVDARELVTLRGGPAGRCLLASNISIGRPPSLAPGTTRWELPWGGQFELLPMDGFSDAIAALMARARGQGAGVVVVVDEVDTIWDAHEWQNMSKYDRYLIKQSRKLGADMIWTAQFVDQVEKSIRNITEEVELVRAFPSPTIRRREKGSRPWVIRGQRFRPAAVRELMAEQDKDKRLGAAWHLYRREHELLYDTDELVMPPRFSEADLCSRHRRELSEERCPHPDHPARSAETGIAALILAASDSATVDRAAAA